MNDMTDRPWQSMATAPKDRTIELYARSGHGDGFALRPMHGTWNPVHKVWVARGGWHIEPRGWRECVS